MAETTPQRALVLSRGDRFELPLFLPVYQPGSGFVPTADWPRYGIEACICNGYFFYRDRELRSRFRAGLRLHDYLGFDGLVMTDSGAFQGFAKKLLLANKAIVRFQEEIGADVVSPLDLVTPPGDSRELARRKMLATVRRVREGLSIVRRGILAGVQQGGRFHDLRRENLEALVEMGCKYIALGSLVPFFTKNHDLAFVGQVLRDARRLAGPVPLHVYGAGDPVELPFLAALGADVFDSSSYIHFARAGYYMTPFGALNDPGPLLAGEYTCRCAACQSTGDPRELLRNAPRLAEHNLFTICTMIRSLRRDRKAGELPQRLAEILERHMAWFPDSRLAASWHSLHERGDNPR